MSLTRSWINALSIVLIVLFLACVSPAQARYLSSDPIGLAGGLNTYAYALDNPLRYIDPSGLSSLSLNGPTGQLCMYSRNGDLLFCCDAANNIDSRVRSNFPNGHWPSGSFPYLRPTTHADDSPNSKFGSFGNLVFDVPGHSDMGVHSGRQDTPDGAGRTGPGHATQGCIRTTDNCMQRIINSMQNDPLTNIDVTW